MNTTVTFRTDEQLKKDATKVYESLGMNLSTALNLFMKQTVIKQGFPCSLELDFVKDNTFTYKPDFFALFGKGSDLGFDEEPEDMPINNEGIEL
jgi:addiction module RelB/DinJ family antitoxin